MKTDRQRLQAFELWCWKRLESSWDCKEIKPVNPKGNQPWIFIGKTDAKTEASGFWLPDANTQLIGKDSDAGKDWKLKEKEVAEDKTVRYHYQLNVHECEQTPGDSEGQGSLASCSPWGLKESDRA